VEINSMTAGKLFDVTREDSQRDGNGIVETSSYFPK
jgi:hypothetical protein